ncbi:MAG: hypothetical protein ABSG43_24110 [Solirubrobacteraceae bacterium]|jgi:hypothetical protein
MRSVRATLVAGAIVGASVLTPAASVANECPPGAQSGTYCEPQHYYFQTLDNGQDPTFNQLLGINQQGVIAGYYGSGAQGHPNKGYKLLAPYRHGRYVSENFPGSAQTQVTGLNDRGVIVGFWSDSDNASQLNANFGFYKLGGSFHTVNFPSGASSSPPVNQLLGVNNSDIAVGFYNDAAGASHGYTYNIKRNRFHPVTIAGATSVTAAAINNRGDIAGFDSTGSGILGFLRRAGGSLTTLAYPGATLTEALGVNDLDEVVGYYETAGSLAPMHGFTWTPRNGFETVNDPKGIDTTTVNGVNDRGQLVGFYVDSTGNTDGMLATPGGGR